MNISTKREATRAFDPEKLQRCLAALADPTRQEIVELLCRQRLNVGQLAERFSLSQPAMSHHLKILNDAGVLRQERLGRERVYRLDQECCRGLAEQFRSFINRCCANARCC